MTLNVSARELRRIELDEGVFDDEITKILQLIEDKIRTAHGDKKTKVAIPLPYIFGIDGIDNNDARLVIYSKILKAIKEKGFKVQIGMNKDRVLISIQWKCYLDNKRIKEMQNVIDSCKIQLRNNNNPITGSRK